MLIRRAYQHIIKKTLESQHQITLFAIVMMINFPLFGLLWEFGSTESYDEFVLRLIATMLCALLATHTFWPKKWRVWLPLLWYVTLSFCLPFFFTYLTLLYHGATTWLMNCVSAVFFLLLVTSVLDAFILLLIGAGSAFLLHYLYFNLPAIYQPGNIGIFDLLITFLAALIIGALFARDRELINAGRISGIRLLAKSLATDMKGPLDSIHLQAELQETLMNQIHNVEVQQVLRDSLHKIARQIDMSQRLISMQLTNMDDDKIDTKDFIIQSIDNLIQQALAEYPFSQQRLADINVDLKEGFTVWLDALAFKNLLWNLLHDMVQHIEVQLVRGDDKDDYNYVVLKTKDSSLFGATSNQKDSLGFAYCKLVMDAAGGAIEYRRGAQMMLKFPKID